MKIKTLFLLLISLNLMNAQSFLGRWEIIQVKLGDQIVTPQSKWFEFSEQGFFGGNGLRINGAGTYIWEEKTQSLSLSDSLGFEDRYEPFKVSWQGDTMFWHREEEGQAVEVMAIPIKQTPMRLSDKAIGIWEPAAEDSLAYLFLRWDRIYIEQFKDGRRFSGVWQAHAHRPELIFLPWDRNKKPRSYIIETGLWEELILRPQDKPKAVKKYSRRRSFPD